MYRKRRDPYQLITGLTIPADQYTMYRLRRALDQLITGSTSLLAREGKAWSSWQSKKAGDLSCWL